MTTPHEEEEQIGLRVASAKAALPNLDNTIMAAEHEIAKINTSLVYYRALRAEYWHFIQIHENVVRAEVDESK